MFDLEQSTLTWRKQMLAAGIKSPVPLEELENHLREEIERQMQLGLGTQKAFEASVQKIGAPQPLKIEFKKIERPVMKTLKIFGAIFGLLAAAVLMLPGFVQLHDQLVMANGRLALWLLGLALAGWSVALLRQGIWPIKTQSADKIKMSLLTKIIKISGGVIVLLTALAFMMPAVAQAVRDGMMQFADLCYLLFGIALFIVGVTVTIFPYQRRQV